MIFRSFRLGTPAVILTVTLTFLVLRLIGFLSFETTLSEDLAPLTLLPFTFSLSGWWGFGISTVLILLALWFFNQSINQFELSETRGFLPMAFGILVFTAHPMWYQVHYQTLVLLLLPFIIRNIFQLAYPTTGHGKVFDTALLIGICCLFYFPTVVLIIWLFQTLLVLRNFNLREWLMPLIGMGLPFLYLWSYRYVMEVEGEWFPIDSFISLGLPSFLSLSHTWLVFALLLTLLTLLTLPRYLRDIQLNKIRVRKSLSMLTWLLVYALIGVFIFKANVHYLTLVVGFPLSLILTIFFEKRETSRWMNYLSYGLIIALLVHLVTGFF